MDTLHNPDPGVELAPQPPARPLIPWGWLRAVIYFPVFIAAIIGGYSIPSSLYELLYHENLDESMTSPWMILVEVMVIAIVLLVTWLFRRFIDRQPMRTLGFEFGGPYRKDLAVGVLWGIGMVAAVFGVLLLTGNVRIVEIGFPIEPILILLVVLALAAFMEEVGVRGYILNNFMKSQRPVLALVCSSLLFSLAHASNPDVDLVSLANIVIAGLVLGVYYIHRRNLWFPVGLHFGWNFFQGVVFGSPVSGIRTPGILTIELSGNPLLSGGKFGFEASLVTTVVTALASVVLYVVYREKTEPIAWRALD